MSYIQPQQLCYVVNPDTEEAFFATSEWAASYALNHIDSAVRVTYSGIVPAGYRLRKFEVTRVDFSSALAKVAL